MLIKKSLLLIPAILMMTACSSSSELTAAGSRVEFVDEKPAESCQFLGSAEGRRSSFFSGTKSHSELMRDAARDLLNQAGAMGGNVIFQAQDGTMKIISDLAPTDIIMKGDVYKCP